MICRRTTWLAGCVVIGALATANTQAVLINAGPGSFTPLATVIDFDVADVPLGTVNPSFTLPAGILGNVTVSFGGHFVGQAASGGFPVTLTDTTPTGPLTLDPLAPVTSTVNDGAPGATSPVLSGTPTFNGPIAVLFSTPVAAVGLKGGFFDAVNSTTIEAYDVNGVSLGSITNSVTGFEFYGLQESSGAAVIAGISFYITGSEPAGFQIDNVTFGGRDVLIDQAVPEPVTAGLSMLALGALALAASRRR